MKILGLIQEAARSRLNLSFLLSWWYFFSFFESAISVATRVDNTPNAATAIFSDDMARAANVAASRSRKLLFMIVAENHSPSPRSVEM